MIVVGLQEVSSEIGLISCLITSTSCSLGGPFICSTDLQYQYNTLKQIIFGEIVSAVCSGGFNSPTSCMIIFTGAQAELSCYSTCKRLKLVSRLLCSSICVASMQYGMSPSSMEGDKNLADFFVILTTSFDRAGQVSIPLCPFSQLRTWRSSLVLAPCAQPEHN